VKRGPVKPSGAVRHVLVVGAGTHFLSGMSYYTWKVVSSLSREVDVSAILMNNLIPKFFYPGRERVGKPLSDVNYDTLPVFDGIDWWWFPSMFRGIAFMRRQRPDVVLLQWWTGAVAHSYLALALAARLGGAKVTIEFHESQDVGEARLPLAQLYAKVMMRLLLHMTSAVVFHSSFDEELVDSNYPISGISRVTIPHGPYDQYALKAEEPIRRECPDDCINILFFGVIRPFKGLEHLVTAFGLLSAEEVASFWLTVVGETWEGWTLPQELIERHRYADHITFVNRYVSDQELAGWLAGADLVVLPYLRSSSSGPLHTSMSAGLPVIITRVGGLPEAAASYEGAVLIDPDDPAAILEALRRHIERQGDAKFSDPHSWERSVERYVHLFNEISD